MYMGAKAASTVEFLGLNEGQQVLKTNFQWMYRLQWQETVKK